MIISASFRTDIPAFYGKWFQNRLEAGYCYVRNPYDGKFHRVSLARQDVDGFCFWTKNLGPFFPNLDLLKSKEFPFIVNYSITGYHRALEPSILSADKAVAQLRLLAKEYGKRIGVWRYDPIVISSLTDFSFHRRNFSALAQALSGATDEVIVSFAEVFKKTQRNLSAAASTHGFQWEDPSDDLKRQFIIKLAQIACEHGLKLSLCAQRQYLSPGINDACCIDVNRLVDISGLKIKETKPGHRGKQCGCNQSRDIGGYDTCPNGCVYCYAVNSADQTKQYYRQFDHSSESLDNSSLPEDSLSMQCALNLI